MALLVFLLIAALAAACFFMGIYCERDILAPERSRKVIDELKGHAPLTSEGVRIPPVSEGARDGQQEVGSGEVAPPQPSSLSFAEGDV